MATFPRRGEVSMARCENVSYLHKSRLARGPLAGTISPALMRDVERGLLRCWALQPDTVRRNTAERRSCNE